MRIEGFSQYKRALSIVVAGITMASGIFSMAPALAVGPTQVSVLANENASGIHQSVYYTLDNASSMISRKEYADAIVLMQKAAEKDPVNIFTHFNLGFAYLELAKIVDEKSSAGQTTPDQKERLHTLLKKAEYHFIRVQNLNPDLPVSYFKLGKIALLMNDSDQAEAYYREGMEVDPSSAPLAFNLGRVYDQRGAVEKAIPMYQKAISLDPDFVYAYNNLGLLYESQKNYAAAEKTYQAALKQDGKYNFARLNLGNLYAELDRLSEAKHQYEAALALEPNNSWAHLYLGNIHFLSGNYQAATRSYQASIAINPEFPTAYYLLALSLSKQDRLDEAMSASLRYMNLEPEGKYSEQLRSLIGALKVQKSSAPATVLQGH